MRKVNTLNQKEFESLLKKPPNVRYEYFIKKVVDWEEVWGLYDDGWAVGDDGEGNMIVPFFPKEEFAQHCAVREWSNYQPKSIDLYSFMEEFLQLMRKKRVKPSIFPTNEDTAVVKIDVLLRDLETELENY
jgi:hypothetical protein